MVSELAQLGQSFGPAEREQAWADDETVQLLAEAIVAAATGDPSVMRAHLNCRNCRSISVMHGF